ncbi:type i restriction-modification system, m subunit [Heliomicrobium modesticaldum Ice1]|uniref:site-specific DNA-methyltransferase (adenine-specific) n=1 Tax=Heliobacterium modesticaldum (strain ATCC 51547 / Ice1) TaxID=498761 RepID=B0TGH6_HELMI|nr:class I SAM-dependent DNA methyltransferase [Heliomicrobium modesticaldum]ABZ83237.1 type i restriction-modification system, m subunit [Heliomicrobium modesticaldum Ice1]
MAISNTTKALKDIMRIDAGINGDAQYIEQIAWLLFLKAFDYKEQEWELEDDYVPVIPEQYRWRNWAEDDEGITGDALIEHVENMFRTLRNLDVSDGDPRKFLVRDVMEGVNNFMKSGTLLRQVINKINADINFDEVKTAHLFNGIYESMLKDLQSAGKAGEFYTPRPVTRFIVDKVNPQLGEIVLDPACGTGGFLTSVIDRFDIKTADEYRTLQKTIRGIEKKPFPFLLCVTNLIAHGIDVPLIRHDNTLRTPTTDYSLADKVDVIVTNPPFGGAEEKAISQSVPAELRNTETADLFLVHIMALLKDGGRCGMVLPDGFLFGTGVKAAIKKKLLEENNLHTIVRLPKDVFAPYTNINTNLLFFTKGKPTQGVWFYRLEMPQGYKHFSKTKPMLYEHFAPVRAWWNNRKESDVSQYVPVEDIIAAEYNLDFCGFPHETEEILPPDEFIAQYRNEKAILTERIESILAKIQIALAQEDVL